MNVAAHDDTVAQKRERIGQRLAAQLLDRVRAGNARRWYPGLDTA
jgi:hypothetical protein